MTIARSAGYFLREATTDLWKRRTVNVISVGTIAASLYIVGLFVLFLTNTARLIASWGQENTISVYLSDSIDEEGRARLDRRLTQDQQIASHVLVSKEEALEKFRKEFPDLADLAVGLESNPLPATIEVVLKEEHAQEPVIEALAGSLEKEPGVEGVRYDLAWVRRVRTLLGLIGMAGAVLGAILLTAAVITIYGVIRLNVQARKEEIEILRLGGATRGFIRRPFLVEGAFQGIAASLLSLALILGTWIWLSGSKSVRGDFLLQGLVGRFLPLWAPRSSVSASRSGSSALFSVPRPRPCTLRSRRPRLSLRLGAGLWTELPITRESGVTSKR